MPPALPAWYAMSLLPSCVSLYTLSISPSANKSQQKVSPTLSCALRLLVTSNILLPKHRNVQLRSGSQRTITSSPTCSSLDKHALLKNISLCDAIVCPPFTEIPPGLQKSAKSSKPKKLAITFSVFLLGLLSWSWIYPHMRLSVVVLIYSWHSASSSSLRYAKSWLRFILSPVLSSKVCSSLSFILAKIQCLYGLQK